MNNCKGHEAFEYCCGRKGALQTKRLRTTAEPQCLKFGIIIGALLIRSLGSIYYSLTSLFEITDFKCKDVTSLQKPQKLVYNMIPPY